VARPTRRDYAWTRLTFPTKYVTRSASETSSASQSHRNGVTVVHVARVSGGAGGGRTNEAGEDKAACLGLRSTPVGVFVIKDGKVSWQPSFDLNRAASAARSRGLCLCSRRVAIIKAIYTNRTADSR
jgi:hypothetical protein